MPARHVARTRGERNSQRVLGGRPEGNRLHRRARRRWEGNINMDIKETGNECVQRTDLAHVRCKWLTVVSTMMNFRGFHETRRVPLTV